MNKFASRNSREQFPSGYQWLVKRGLVGFAPNTQLQPWYFLEADNIFDAAQKWSDGVLSDRPLMVFAKRQDNDDLACFYYKSRETPKVAIIEGWIGNNYDVVAIYDSFWEWLKAIIDDIQEWAEL